eukprot:TRINITY_DN65138_c0_g1_i1.p1 TRINITY_DN65138_c0_g1~~TRINITY_DN65138_c0_g1_i1.p1  ORF type:complete len:143 (-),score=11.65 TRINITY_DN65138_c0_g1_i1:19-447(-)
MTSRHSSAGKSTRPTCPSQAAVLHKRHIGRQSCARRPTVRPQRNLPPPSASPSLSARYEMRITTFAFALLSSAAAGAAAVDWPAPEMSSRNPAIQAVTQQLPRRPRDSPRYKILAMCNYKYKPTSSSTGTGAVTAAGAGCAL